MRKWLKRVAIGIVSLLVLAAAVDAITYSPTVWLSDYGRLKRDMAQGYANLDWIAEKRRLRLDALDRQTTGRLRSAYSRVRAYLALQDFVAAFRDPHLELVFGSGPAGASSAGTTSQVDPPAGQDCAAAGYADDFGEFHSGLGKLPGWQPLAGAGFPAALAGEVGFIRIGSFREQGHGAACVRAFRAGIGQRALQLATRAILQEQMRDRIEELRKSGATRLVVDLTGNGGGSEWATEAAALFSGRPLRRREPLLAGPGCDRSPVWTGARAPCPVFAMPGQEVAEMQGAGAWTGPLLILADRRTASASEEFIAWLHGSNAATLLGERTLGAGCGHVGEPRVTWFRSAPIAVRMPNCARFLADGTNEIEGIEPDVQLPMDDEEGFTAGLKQALGGNF